MGNMPIIPSMEITEVLPSVSFDKENLKNWALQIQGKYENLAVTEEDLVSIKEIMADLNKASKLINDRRKEIVRNVSAPIKTFEADVKEIDGIILATREKLDKQVSFFINKQREEKAQVVQRLIDELQELHEGLIIPMDEVWLNKTTTMAQIKRDLNTIVEAFKELEERLALEEKAKRARIETLESIINLKNESTGLNLAVSVAMIPKWLDITTPIQEVTHGINQIYEDVQAQKESVEAENAQLKAAQAQTQVQTTVDNSVEETWQVTFKASGDVLVAMKDFFRSRKAMCEIFTAKRIS